MATVYVETTIVGYLTVRSSDAVIFLARQQLTRRWWNDQRSGFELFASQLVLAEVEPPLIVTPEEFSGDA